MNKVNLHDLFFSNQQDIDSSFKKSSQLIHSVDKGTGVENIWFDWVDKYFPKRYRPLKGTVVDYQGNCSDQIDLIIYDSYYSPLIFECEGVKYIPVEAVYAVFEIKQEVNSSYLKYAARKVESVRNLKITSAPIRQITGEFISRDTNYTILGGLLAPKVKWSNSNIQKNLMKCLKTNCSNYKNHLNIVVSLDSFSALFSHDNNSIKLERFDGKNILFATYFNILQSLQRIGNLPAIDYDLYREG